MPDWLDPLLTHTEPSAAATGSTASKRTLIVEAARTVLRRDGIAKLSMRRVAVEAGVALGLAHYHFASKSALLAAVVETRTVPGALEGAEPAPPPSEGLIGILRDEPAATLDGLRFGVDIDSQALREPLVASAAASLRRDREAALVDRLRAARLLTPADRAEPLAAVLMAAIDGLEVRAAIDPAFDLGAARRMLERLCGAARTV